MFATTLLCQVLLATAAFAIPTSKERFAQRVARRAGGLTHQSHPKKLVSTLPVTESKEALSGNVSHSTYSENWSGAVLSESTATYQSVTGTFVVPTPQEPSGDSGAHYASAWVGIDGATCSTAILQTGVDFNVDGTTVSYDAWYEWYPDYAYDFSGITFSAGDSVTVTVTATSTTGGTAEITNESTGETVSHTFSGQPALCEYDAEWIVEDFSSTDGLVPFADFGNVTFTGASAGTVGGTTVGPSGAELIDIMQDDQVLTSVSTGSNSVTVSYVG
ncbi:aspergillopepsin [Ganoderma leucocontextum]|nr:aspergillopepsin [Ganoderma leucocontextum]